MRPKYHFLTITQRNGGGTTVTALPGQTFGRNSVPTQILVKDARDSKVISKARAKGSVGEIFYTTTLVMKGRCLEARDIYPLKGNDNVLYHDAQEWYDKLYPHPAP